MTRVHDAFPAKNAYWTEGGPDYTSPDYQTDWAKWSHTYSEVLRNWARCIVGWNLILDENGKPDIGPFSCGGVVTVNSKTHALTRSGQYWAFAHYSKVIERGAQVIGSHGELKDISHVAFENPDGRRVLVLTNQGGEQQISCQAGNQAMDLTLEPDSVTTLLL
jgi:glucosylceramidase